MVSSKKHQPACKELIPWVWSRAALWYFIFKL